ncbi:MAG TPA: S8 family peptidase [Pyrinomonadaceae bacterium]|nr:S8 family peptidase [Pyrinomonadaceae bacterium]
MKKIVFVLLAFTVGIFALSYAPVQSTAQSDKTDKIKKAKNKIPDRYIVVLEEWVTGEPGENSNAEAVAEELSIVYGGKIDKIFKHALNGFSVEMNENQAEKLSEDSRVKFVEEDGVVYANTTQSNATWGLDRIDQRDRPTDGNYNYTPTGSGVNAYIIDTGIRRTHAEFGGRAVVGYDAIGDGQNSNDCNGHGTHVAGTTGGSTYGVAKAVRLYAVRVLNCTGSGSNSGVIAGVDWVKNNHIKPAVANMSLGGGASSALDTAVNNAIAAGVTFAVAAGNDNLDACNYSPARVANAITVGSTTNTDARSSFSNFGTCLDIFAPGSSITSAWFTSDTATNMISGTSMASPHVAGVAALYLQGNTTASPSTVTSAITGEASANKLTSIGTGSPNRLLYSLLSSGSTGSELLVNGTLESSSSPWVLSGSGAFYTANGSYPQGGTGYLYFGVNNSVTGQTYQQVSIPSAATGTLTFWLNVSSNETTTTTQYDKLFIEVRNTSGSLLTTLATYSNLSKGTAGVYSQKSLDLSAYKGQTVRVQFRTTTDGSQTTTFRVDTASLK